MNLYSKYKNCDEIEKINEAFEDVLENEDSYEINEVDSSDILNRYNKKNENNNYEEVKRIFSDNSPENKFFGFVPVNFLDSHGFVTQIEGDGRNKPEIFDPVEEKCVYLSPDSISLGEIDFEKDPILKMEVSVAKKKYIDFKMKQVMSAIDKNDTGVINFPDNEKIYNTFLFLFKTIPVFKKIGLKQVGWKNENNFSSKQEFHLVTLLKIIEGAMKHHDFKKKVDMENSPHQWFINKIEELRKPEKANPEWKLNLNDVDLESFFNPVPPSIVGTEYEKFFKEPVEEAMSIDDIIKTGKERHEDLYKDVDTRSPYEKGMASTSQALKGDWSSTKEKIKKTKWKDAKLSYRDIVEALSIVKKEQYKEESFSETWNDSADFKNLKNFNVVAFYSGRYVGVEFIDGLDNGQHVRHWEASNSGSNNFYHDYVLDALEAKIAEQFDITVKFRGMRVAPNKEFDEKFGAKVTMFKITGVEFSSDGTFDKEGNKLYEDCLTTVDEEIEDILSE